VLEGRWVADKVEKAKLTYSDGSIYEGQFEDNKVISTLSAQMTYKFIHSDMELDCSSHEMAAPTQVVGKMVDERGVGLLMISEVPLTTVSGTMTAYV
jgi:hypothetical protein